VACTVVWRGVRHCHQNVIAKAEVQSFARGMDNAGRQPCCVAQRRSDRANVSRQWKLGSSYFSPHCAPGPVGWCGVHRGVARCASFKRRFFKAKVQAFTRGMEGRAPRCVAQRRSDRANVSRQWKLGFFIFLSSLRPRACWMVWCAPWRSVAVRHCQGVRQTSRHLCVEWTTQAGSHVAWPSGAQIELM
jgi:hypothetical protein